MATDLSPLQSPPVEAVPPPESPRRRRLPRLLRRPGIPAFAGRMYGGRMLLVYALLIAAVGGGIAAAVLVPDAKHKPSATFNLGSWSTWAPAESSTSRTGEIGVHVGATYLGRNGNEYAYVVAEPPQWEGSPVIAAAIHGEVGSVDRVSLTPDTATAMFTLCGPQDQCTLDQSGSAQDHLVYLRREALELALYTFHYVSAVSNVLVMLPRLDQSGTPYVLFWRRGELAGPLRQPLGETLSEKTPAFGKVPTAEKDALHNLADPYLYRARPLTALDGTVVFALTHVPLG